MWHIGFRIRVEGRENLKKVQTKGYILAPTHVSAIDPVFIVITRWGRRMVVFAKKELFEINAFLTGSSAAAAACASAAPGRDGGHLSDGGGLQAGARPCSSSRRAPAKKGGQASAPKSGLFVIAAEAGVDVVPCRILYDTPDGRMHLFCKVRVIYGEPMPAAQFAMEGRRDTKKLRANKQALLEAWGKNGGRKRWRSVWRKRGVLLWREPCRGTDLRPAGRGA